MGPGGRDPEVFYSGWIHPQRKYKRDGGDPETEAVDGANLFLHAPSAEFRGACDQLMPGHGTDAEK